MLKLATKVAGGPWQARSGIISETAATLRFLWGVKHVDSDGPYSLSAVPGGMLAPSVLAGLIALVAKSPADGYMLLVNTSAQVYSAALLKNLPYAP